MKVGVIGPRGDRGKCVVDELLSRGHEVVGISRSPPLSWALPGTYSGLLADIFNVKTFSRALSSGFDAIVCAYGPPLSDEATTFKVCVEAHGRIKSALLASTHNGPFVIIGGAASLHFSDGTQFCDQKDFLYNYWYQYSDSHIDMIVARVRERGLIAMAIFFWCFRWAKNNVEHPGLFSIWGRPLALLFLGVSRRILPTVPPHGLMRGTRMALTMWEGVRDKSWSFVSPPGFLRDNGKRTGRYEAFFDSPTSGSERAVYGTIDNEDLAVAIVDEVEANKRNHCHWTCISENI